MLTRRTTLFLTAVLGSFAFWGAAHAQATYPDKPIKFIVALPAGGSVDMIARTLGQKLSCRRWASLWSSTTAPVARVRSACPWWPKRLPMATRSRSRRRRS
jgi:hypothetical protein